VLKKLLKILKTQIMISEKKYQEALETIKNYENQLKEKAEKSNYDYKNITFEQFFKLIEDPTHFDNIKKLTKTDEEFKMKVIGFQKQNYETQTPEEWAQQKAEAKALAERLRKRGVL
jgi:hypothetical protein